MMEEEELRIGPYIYHAVVCAYVRASDPEGAVGVLKRLHLDGERALSETYVMLLKGFTLQMDLSRAEDVVRTRVPPERCSQFTHYKRSERYIWAHQASVSSLSEPLQEHCT
jgi:pentatricopeptide repeat protein